MREIGQSMSINRERGKTDWVSANTNGGPQSARTAVCTTPRCRNVRPIGYFLGRITVRLAFVALLNCRLKFSGVFVWKLL
jgi:hypothetical protein